MNELFYELVRVALGNADGLTHIPSEKEWKLLYEMAKKQSLVGVCFAAIQKILSNSSLKGKKPSVIGMPEMIYMNWMGMAAKIQQMNEIVNRQCVELQERLSCDGHRNYIMKGQSNAALYGELQMLRQSGDIDVYLEGGLDKVLAYARTFGNVEHVNELEMSVPVFQNTEVEFHYRPFIMRNPWKNKRLQRFFKEQEAVCFENRISLGEGLSICAPTTEFNLVHQLTHIHLHLFTEGIGMRQLMDYYFVLRSASQEGKIGFAKNTVFKKPEKTAESVSSGSTNLGNADSTSEFESTLPSSAANSSLDAAGIKGTDSTNNIKNIREVVSDLGLNQFASALMWVLEYVFTSTNSAKIPKEEWMLWEPQEKDGRLLLEEVMTGGNFGRHNEEQNDRKRKMGYSVWALFVRNLRLSRFDRGDWFWGPIWRISHKLTRKKI